MNFLALCQRTRQECGITGGGPLNTEGQTGEYRLVVDWVRNAWLEIQAMSTSWRFLRASTNAITTAGDFAILPPDFASLADLTLNTDDAIESLCYLPLEQFKDRYRLTKKQDAKPSVYTIEGQSLIFDTASTASYSLNLEYYRTPQELTTNTDAPLMPERFHMLIVYKAMEQYAFYENAPEVSARAIAGWNSLINQLYNDQLPEIQLAGPLA